MGLLFLAKYLSYAVLRQSWWTSCKYFYMKGLDLFFQYILHGIATWLLPHLSKFFNHKICEYTSISMFALTTFSFHILSNFYFVHITREDKYIIMYCIFIFALYTGLLSNKLVERICHDTKWCWHSRQAK